MSTADQTGYGLRDGVLWYIADVPSGLSCGCVCARCGKRLVAKKGPIRQHHFAHYEDTDCHGAAESALHRLAKELLAELTSLELPPYIYHRRRKTRGERIVEHRQQVLSHGAAIIGQVSVELHAGDIIPDLLITTDAGAFIVEVAVTHKVDRTKLRKLRRRNLPAIEIRLHAGDSFLPRDALQRKLQKDLACKSWLFHPEQRHAERIFAAMYRQEIARSRHRPVVTFTPRSARPQAAARPHVPRRLNKRSDWWEQNRFGEQFNRQHGRYPSIEECQRLRPDLFGSKKS